MAWLTLVLILGIIINQVITLKKISRLFAFIAAFIPAVICIFLLISSVDGDGKMQNELYLREYKPTAQYVKHLGRTYFDGSGLLLSYSGSGFEFYCEGTYAEITLSSQDVASADRAPRYAVFVNGKSVCDETLTGEKTLYLTLTQKSSVVRLVKLSEAMYSSIYVSGISVCSNSDIEPTEKSALSIEFIGDSITCGYGIDAGTVGYFSTSTENCTKTYAYLTAQNLGADYSAICYSGYGVYSGYTLGGRNPAVLLPEYKKAYYTDEIGRWSFAENQSDVVVINLGTNDASYCAGSTYLRGQFVSAYKELLSAVRENNPAAHVLCILGDMNNSMFSSIEKAVDEYKNETGDSRVTAFTVDFKMGENEIVIDGHPGEMSNRIAADFLTAKIREIIGGTF